MMSTSLVISLVTVTVVISVPAPDTDNDLPSPLATDIDTLDKLFQDYFQWKASTYPFWATSENIDGYDDLVNDYSPDRFRTRAVQCREFLTRSKNLQADSHDNELYQKIFESEVAACADGDKINNWFAPVNVMENVAVDIPRLIEKTPLDSIRDYENLLSRLQKVPDMIRQIKDVLRMGIKEGATYAKESMKGVDAAFEKLQVGAEQSVFYAKFRDMSGSLGRRVVDRLQTTAYNLTENEILPAFLDLQEFLRYAKSNK